MELKELKVNKSIRINEDLVLYVERRADSEQRTFSNLVTKILKEWKETQENKAA